MFLSRTEGTTTTTIKVKTGRDLLYAAAFAFVGFGLTNAAIADGPIRHWQAVAFGLLLLLIGCALGMATLRLIFRGWRTYENATRRPK